MKTLQWTRSLVLGLWAIMTIGCGHYPSHITSLHDIRRTSSSETHITTAGLAVEDVAALSKFQSLYELDFDGGATDQHLEALGKIGFPKLAQVVLTDCPNVTESGVSSLVRVATLQGLGLRGTGVGDEGCRVVARSMRLKSINLSRSPNVTVNGLLALAQSETIEVLGFSQHGLTQDELLRIIHAAHKINHMEIDIVDGADRKLDLPELRNAAEAKGINLLGVRNQSVSAL